MSTEIMTRPEGGTLPAMMEASPLDRVLAMMESGQPVQVEVLERLAALEIRLKERSARDAYFQALSAFQEECPQIRKSKTANITTRSGGSYGYTYAPLDEIARIIRPILRRHGLSFFFTASANDNSMLEVKCILRHVEGHKEEASFPVPTDTKAEMSGAQKNGAALTYGRRQALISVLGLTTTDSDVDASAAREIERITREQAADLQVLMDEVNADRPRFFAWAGVQDLHDLPKSKLAEATRILEEKRRRV